MDTIFIHGLGQKPSSWDKTVSQMKKSGQRYHCPDLFDLPHHQELTYKNVYEAFSNYCNQIPGTLYLCGLSLGAILAINYSLDYPEKVSTLVLIGAQYRMPKGLLYIQNIVFHFMPEKAFLEMGIHKKDLICLTKSMMELDFSAQLKDIQIPSYILCGGKDKANQTASKEIAAKIPGAKLFIIENTGHEANTEAPDKLAEILNTI